MTFRQVVDAVLADRFKESQRADAKQWVNFRLGWFFDMEDWTFTYGTDDVTVTSGSQTVSSLPDDFHAALSLLASDGTPLRGISDHAEFYERYYNNESPESGTPEAYTVIGGTILVGPTSDETETDYKLVYKKACTLLSADGDIPAIPTELHFALVHGGAAEGLKLQNDPTWQSFEQDFQAAIQVARRKYLNDLPGAVEQFPAYRPGG